MEQLGKLRLRHARAVVRHGKDQRAVLASAANIDVPAALAALERAVDNGVLDQRLQDKIERLSGIRDAAAVNARLERVPVHHALDGDIGADVLHLVPDGDHIASAIEAGAVKRGKLYRRPAQFLVAALDGLPIDERQRVIEEMRVDLRAEHRHFQIANLLLRFLRLRHQRAHPVQHVGKLIA